MKIWSSHLLDNLSNCLMNLKNSGNSSGFEPMTSAMPVQCSNQLSYEVTQWRASQFVGLMFSRERNVIWKRCYMQCGVWNQVKIWSCTGIAEVMGSNPVESPEFFRFMRQFKNCPASARIISSLDFFTWLHCLAWIMFACHTCQC